MCSLRYWKLQPITVTAVFCLNPLLSATQSVRNQTTYLVEGYLLQSSPSGPARTIDFDCFSPPVQAEVACYLRSLVVRELVAVRDSACSPAGIQNFSVPSGAGSSGLYLVARQIFHSGDER